MLPRQDRSYSSPSDLKALSLSVSFNGWRRANSSFKSWARKMSDLHKPTWKKAGIFEAVMASTKRIHKNTDLVLGIAEKWCHDTKTFVFRWGEATITLEDVMLLLGFSVLGSPVFATLDSSGERIKEKLEKEWQKIKKDKKSQFVTQVLWMVRFMDRGDELEHVAFLALWLSYYVFPSRYYHLPKDTFSVAVHLSSGTRIALAPAVLAHLYAELSLLKNHIRDFTIATITDKIELASLFKLVQVWTGERFRELRPKPNMMLEGEPRMARWDDSKLQITSHVREILENSKMDTFEWRPYTKAVENWKFPQFYPEKAMSVPVGPNLDDEFISFARCIKVFKLVGIDCVEHYFPNRVASQFGLFQDVPCPVNRNNLSKEAAWDEYNKPIDDLTLYIPARSAKPRFTSKFCVWWRKSSLEFQYSSEENRVEESAETLTPRNIIGDDDTSNFVPSGSKRQKYMKRIRDNDESNLSRCETQVPSDNDEEDDSLTIGQIMGLRKKKYVKDNGRDASGQLGKKHRFEADSSDSGPRQKLASIRADGNETVPPPEIEQRNEETDENNSSDSPKVLPLSQVLQKLGKGFPEKLKRSRKPRTTKNVRSEIKKGKIRDCGGSASREVPLSVLFQKDLMKRKSEHLGNKRAREDDDESCTDCYDNNYTLEVIRYREKIGVDAFESLGNKSRPEADSNDSWICQKLASEDETVAPREIEQRSIENDEEEEAGKNTVLFQANENNSSDPLLGVNGGVVEIVVSPPETRQNCDDEVINADKKKTMVDDGTKEAKCLLHEDGEKQSFNEKEDDDDDDDERLKERKLAIYELASNLEARMMKVEKTFAKIRKWKTRRNQAKNGVYA